MPPELPPAGHASRRFLLESVSGSKVFEGAEAGEEMAGREGRIALF